MLSRVADSVFWMSRYVERAENVARFIDVNLNLTLDLGPAHGSQWAPLVYTTGDHTGFLDRFARLHAGEGDRVPGVRPEEPQFDPVLLAAGPRKRPHRARDDLVGHVGGDQQVLLDGQRRGGRPEQDPLDVRFFQSGQAQQSPAARRDRRHDVARRGLALRPHRPVDRTGRQDVADPGRQIFPAAADGGRGRHAAGHDSMGRSAEVGQRPGNVSPPLRPHHCRPRWPTS